VRRRPITLAKLPHIDDIAIQDKTFRAYSLEVAQEFLGMAAIGAKMYIGQYDELYVTLLFFAHTSFS
jgi:hypothetical protein